MSADSIDGLLRTRDLRIADSQDNVVGFQAGELGSATGKPVPA